jgi:RNA polymerase sigma-70 factor (ECF subfamily)
MITAARVMNDEETYRRYSQELTRYATGLVGPFDAHDVVTDACLRAFETRAWPDVVDRRAYLYRTVLSVATDHHRRTLSRRVRELKTAPPPGVEMTTEDIDVLRAIERLSVQQRSVIFLTYWEDLTPSAVAERLDVSEGSVKRHLARARKRLGELLS